MKMDSVWFVAHGLAGYGPDSENAQECDSWTALADALAYELGHDADFAMEGAYISGDTEGDYEEAWKQFKLAEDLGQLARSLDNNRRNAPLYKDDADAWDATIKRIVEDNFPKDVNHNTRLYAWAVDASTELECGCIAGDVVADGHRAECERDR